jgi:hypothetical protein
MCQDLERFAGVAAPYSERSKVEEHIVKDEVISDRYGDSTR